MFPAVKALKRGSRGFEERPIVMVDGAVRACCGKGFAVVAERYGLLVVVVVCGLMTVRDRETGFLDERACGAWFEVRAVVRVVGGIEDLELACC